MPLLARHLLRLCFGCAAPWVAACGAAELAPPTSAQDAAGGNAGTRDDSGMAGSSTAGTATATGSTSDSTSVGSGGAGSGGAGGASGSGGAAGSGGAVDREGGASDGALAEANGFDAGQPDAESGDGGIPKCTPLPDGTGHLVFQTSGGLTVDDLLGNSATCDSTWSADNGLYLSFFVPVPVGDTGGNPNAILTVRVPGARPGVVTTNEPAIFDFLMTGHIWEAMSGCTATLTGNALVASGPAYEITGSVTCVMPVPEVFGRDPLVVVKLEFVASATPN